MRFTRLASLALFLIAPFSPVSAGQNEVLRVVAMGRAYQASEADRDSARRRAVVDALANAVLSGGAQLRGHTAMSNGRIVSDLGILRPTGRVLSHQVIEENYRNGIWFISISAEVGAQPQNGCSSRRQLVVTAEPPQFRGDPRAPAWAEGVGRTVLNGLIQDISEHPVIVLDRIVEAAPINDDAMNYLQLTQGRAHQAEGDHRLRSHGRVGVEGQNVVFTVELAFSGPDGTVARRTFVAASRNPKGGVMDLLSMSGRKKAEEHLRQDLRRQVVDYLDVLTCEAPTALVALNGKELSVPIGQRHGVARTAIAIVDDPEDGFGLLEVTSVSGSRAVLRPIDPTRSPSGFAGRRVYFLDAGL